MTDGKQTASPPVPSEDAVVVERLLAAGATIVAKTNIDAGFGVVRNPRNPRFHTGGSSSGSAAAVAGGLVDAALGADQGGSIRMPSAWCGLVGMKATHGLVPSFGLVYWDHTLDYIGPMTTTVATNAAVLEVIAGGDWRDPQWVRRDPVAGDYGSAALQGIEGLRIGVIEEALAGSGCTAETLAVFESAQETLTRLGAVVVPVSLPLWADAVSIWFAVAIFGLGGMADSLGRGYGHLGRVDVDVLTKTAEAYWRGDRGVRFDQHTLALLFEHLSETDLGRQFGRGQNLRLELRRQLDAVLDDVDLLITPTAPVGPAEIGSKPQVQDDPPKLRFNALLNTCPLNLTGHPALTVPSGTDANDVPMGLQIIGRRFDEYTVYRAAFAFEAGH
jgi:amidase